MIMHIFDMYAIYIGFNISNEMKIHEIIAYSIAQIRFDIFHCAK